MYYIKLKVLLISAIAVTMILFIPSVYALIEEIDETRHFTITHSEKWRNLTSHELDPNIQECGRMGLPDMSCITRINASSIEHLDIDCSTPPNSHFRECKNEQSWEDPVIGFSYSFFPHATLENTASPFSTLDVLCHYHAYGGYECTGLEETEEQFYEKDSYQIHRQDGLIVWGEPEDLGPREFITSITYTNGLEYWNILSFVELKSFDSWEDGNYFVVDPVTEEEIENIIDSFKPIPCSEYSTTKINIEGEENPLLKQRVTYTVEIEDPMDAGRASFGILINTLDHSREKTSAGGGSDGYQIVNSEEFRVSGGGGTEEFLVYFDKFTYSPGQYEIQIVNGCNVEVFPITIHDEDFIEVEEVSTVPKWIKNNAEWWASGQIDDDTFIQSIQFLIKEEIIVIEKEVQLQEDRTKNIPLWVKNNAKLWSEGSITENDFLKGIEFLIQLGIIQV